MSARRWEPVIGLEIHVQLATDSKLFSCAANDFGAPPNTQVDPVSLGMPGALPVLNRSVVELALRLGLALGCRINRRSRFARKHYFYPDLPKGYQISQFEEPLCEGGQITCQVDGHEKCFRLTRIHLEEDAGKIIHDPDRGHSYIDYNRAGIPLVETVSEPEMRSSAEAVSYMKALHETVVALGVCEGNMEQGHFRCDANVSVRREGGALGTRVELKNINSFRFVKRAIDYEIARQIACLESGSEVRQQTRMWDDIAGCTKVMREKEDAQDYRYFPDPDLKPIWVEEAWIASIHAALPELPRAKRQRYVKEYRLSPYDAEVLTQDVARAAYFESVVAEGIDAKEVANWVQGELLGRLNKADLRIDKSPVSPQALSELLRLLSTGALSSKMAKACFQAMFDEGISPGHWVEDHGAQITDVKLLRAQVIEVLDAHSEQVTAYCGGKVKLLGFFVGQVMKVTQGKANPNMVRELVQKLIEER